MVWKKYWAQQFDLENHFKIINSKFYVKESGFD
jgi:hypothetical protein